VDVVDYSKNHKTATYVSKYLKQYGYSCIASVTFLKKAYPTMVSYDARLYAYPVGTVNVPEGTYFRSDDTLLGVSPTQVDLDGSKLVYYYGDYTVTAYTDGTFEVLSNDGTSQTFGMAVPNATLEYYGTGQYIVKELK
jgi:hypothetical protein